MEPFDTINKCLLQGRSGVLATITSRVGATPRDAGAKVFIDDEGSIHGTIGGGCVEAEVWHHAKSVASTGQCRNLRYALNGKTVEDEGMICGGTLEFFLEPVSVKHKEVYEIILECLSGGERALVITNAGGLPFTKSVVTESGVRKGDPPFFDPEKEKFDKFFKGPPLSFQDGFLIEAVAPYPYLYIYGAGHISQHISRMAKAVDFHVTVIDDRDSFANKDRFPEADDIIVEDFGETDELKGPRSNGYAVIVTRGHKHDGIVLENILKNPPHYVGMIGSKRKVKILFDDLRTKGIADELLRAVHAPIGIDIGAETPQEIAVSIVAELVKTRSSRL